MRISDWSSDVCSSDLGAGGDPGLEADVVTQPPHVVDVVEVPAQRLPVGEALVPVPVLPEVGVGVLVQRDVGVHPGPGVAVQVPDAAETGAGLDQGDAQAQAAEVVELVQPGEAGERKSIRVNSSIYCASRTEFLV